MSVSMTLFTNQCSSVTTATDTETGDSSSNLGKEEDWDRIDSVSDLDAAVNELQVVDG